MGHREDRTWRRGDEEGAREKMEPSCLDGDMEVGSWNPRRCALGIMVLEEVISGVEPRRLGNRESSPG